jgi:hypothetical protein
LKKEIGKKLQEILGGIVSAEKKLINEIKSSSTENNGKNKINLLRNFLLSFASRTASRDRLNIFTTNYDRIIEYGLDESGILTLDRFMVKLNR